MGEALTNQPVAHAHTVMLSAAAPEVRVGTCQVDGGYREVPSTVPSIGQKLYYYSSSMDTWLSCQVTQVSLQGDIMLDVKPGAWITKDQQTTDVRPRGAEETLPPLSRAAFSATAAPASNSSPA